MIKLRNFVAVMVMAAFVLMGADSARAANVSGQIQYTFSGTCSDCTGFGVGNLVLMNYTAGTMATAANFVSFNYSSNLISYVVTAANLNSFNATIGPALPGAAAVDLAASGYTMQFTSQTNGYWCTGSSCLNDNGPASSWSAASSPVPEPGSIALLISGLAGLGAVSRRNAKIR